mmetsp:Transcript_2782/g.4157  ORF Transcript_2782/g.4157 Transcript_2782/m.4157 type:complete len:483 (-) Transcript_2782:24-1472(-)
MTQISSIALLSFITSTVVDSHGYLKSPRSRNFMANQEGGSSDDKYPKEHCPHCLNLGGTAGRCGVTGTHSYDIPSNNAGNVMPADPQIVAQSGSQITVDIVLTAHHKGHFEFKACVISSPDQAPSQACFDANPLTLVRDELYGSLSDPNYPTRAYIPPASYIGLQQDPSGVDGSFYQYTLQLPASAVGDLVLLQWHYLTANSCIFEGYHDYEFPAYWGGMGYDLAGYCSIPLPPDGRGVPEQFWNCAEMSIIDGPVGPSTPDPTAVLPPTTPAPVSEAPIYKAPPAPPTSPIAPVAPVSLPTDLVSADPTSAPSNDQEFCGNGSVGNGVCQNSNFCCSTWGWCGTTVDHCNGQDDPPPSPISTTAPPVTPTNNNDDDSNWVLSTASRCGLDEADARGHCRNTCATNEDCDPGQACWVVHPNFCGSKPDPVVTCDTPQYGSRCGVSELWARETCGTSCAWNHPCTGAGESCFSIVSNFCQCSA